MIPRTAMAPPLTRKGFALLAPSLVLAAAGCGADAYGHSRIYSPHDAEETAAQGAEDYDPVMVKRQPEAWQKKKVSLFGVVTKRADLPGGKADLVLSMRTLEPRNLCETASEDSCRTTVSDNEHDTVHAVVTFVAATDEIGQYSIGTGSLVRVVGTVASPDAADATQVIEASYYRHWPRGFFVTRSAASVMRR
jgi:hypothetical protein